MPRPRARPEETLINTVLLRTMKQAKYSAENVGHFGLAAETYTHFTSPIRRYPGPDRAPHPEGGHEGQAEGCSLYGAACRNTSGQADHCSIRERTAMEAERDVITMLKLEFMKDKVGEVYDGIITGVLQFGFFVQLRELFVEGLVHVSSLADDYYHYVEKLHCLRGNGRSACTASAIRCGCGWTASTLSGSGSIFHWRSKRSLENRQVS